MIGSEGGFIEPVVNAISLHQLKKQRQGCSLLQYFLEEFGEFDSEKFLSAPRELCPELCCILFILLFHSS